MRQDLEKNFNYVKDRRVSNPRYIVLAISSVEVSSGKNCTNEDERKAAF